MYIDEHDIHDFRILNRLISNSRYARVLNEYNVKVQDLLRDTLNADILNQEHKR